jgi:hypothetical protein
MEEMLMVAGIVVFVLIGAITVGVVIYYSR